jgi:NADH-quinone oxidoreductase subunit C
MTEEPKDPQAAGDKPASDTPGEPLKGEVSRTDSPGAGASAAPTAPPAPPAPKPENPAHATTATTSETSSVTGQPTAPLGAEAANAAKAAAAEAVAAAKPPTAAAPVAPAAPKPTAPAAAKPAVSGAAASPAAKAAAAHDTKPAPPAGPTDPPPPAGADVPAFISAVQSVVADGVTQISFYVGDWTMIVPATKLLEVGRFLRETPEAGFDFCSDVTASDWPTRPQRFDVIYCLFSTRHRKRVRLKVRASETEPVPSVSGIWPAANWLEREVYDLFGVNFTGHPNRKRILMPDDWQGHPQRKDYPLEGPGELLMENPLDWLKLKQAREEAEIE